MKSKWLIRRRAAALLAKVERDPSPANLDALKSWGEQDPRHSAVLGSGQSVLRAAAQLRSSNVMPLPRRRRHPRLSLAAATAVAFISAGALVLLWQSSRQTYEAVSLATSIGQIRQVPLSDGSKVILDTGTAVRLEMGSHRRQAVLDHGRARFVIAATEAPFTIRTATTAVELRNGIIDVSCYGEDPEIRLLSGHAQIAREDRNRNERVVVAAPASISTFRGIHAVEAHESSNWPNGQLSFTSARVADIIAASNRYTRTKIIVTDRSIGELAVSGVFRAGDAEGLARSLSGALGLRLDADREGNLILERGEHPSE